MTNILFSLSNDTSLEILFDWLKLNDLVKLDSCVSGKKMRQELYALFEDPQAAIAKSFSDKQWGWILSHRLKVKDIYVNAKYSNKNILFWKHDFNCSLTISLQIIGATQQDMKDKQLYDTLFTCAKLRVLKLETVDCMTNEIFENATKDIVKNMTTIEITRCPLFLSTSISFIAQHCRFLTCVALRFVHLDDCPEDNQILALLARNTGLETLRLTSPPSYSFSLESPRSLSADILESISVNCSHIKHVEFSTINVTFNQMLTFITEHPALRTCKLENCEGTKVVYECTLDKYGWGMKTIEIENVSGGAADHEQSLRTFFQQNTKFVYVTFVDVMALSYDLCEIIFRGGKFMSKFVCSDCGDFTLSKAQQNALTSFVDEDLQRNMAFYFR